MGISRRGPVLAWAGVLAAGVVWLLLLAPDALVRDRIASLRSAPKVAVTVLLADVPYAEREQGGEELPASFSLPEKDDGR